MSERRVRAEERSPGPSAVTGGRRPAKLPEAERRAVERLFEAVADYTYDWETWMGPDGRPRWINPAVERMTGYTVEEWADLARAVAACSGRKTADLLTERDLEEVADYPPLPWDEAVDGPLPKADGD